MMGSHGGWNVGGELLECVKSMLESSTLRLHTVQQGKVWKEQWATSLLAPSLHVIGSAAPANSAFPIWMKICSQIHVQTMFLPTIDIIIVFHCLCIAAIVIS